MNFLKNIAIPVPIISLLVSFMGGPLVCRAQQTFTVTPSLAFQTSFTAKDGFQYEVQGSTNLTTWGTVSERRSSPGGSETFNLSFSNRTSQYFRVAEFPPDLTRRIIGLSEIYFDNAILTSVGPQMFAEGIRIVSRDFNLNDFVTAKFVFDPLKQGMSMSDISVKTNVGLTLGQDPIFFMKNVAPITMQIGSTILSSRTTYNLNASGQAITADLIAGQVLAFVVSPVQENIHLTMLSPQNEVIRDYLLTPPITTFVGPINIFDSGRYTFKISPASGSSLVTFRFAGLNYTGNSVLVNNQTYSTSLGDYLYDYAKSTVALNAGQTLQMAFPGAGAYFRIYNSRGVLLQNFIGTGSTPWRFTASVSGTYYLVYSHDDFQTHNYTSAISITP